MDPEQGWYEEDDTVNPYWYEENDGSRVRPGYMVVHKLVKNKCATCGEPPKDVKRELWVKNDLFHVNQGNKEYTTIMGACYEIQNTLVTCSEYCVLLVSTE